MVKIIIVATIVGVIGFVGTFDADDNARQQSLYCEMVAEYDASGGDTGWPPFNGREMCDE
jgi:hypothetical protein